MAEGRAEFAITLSVLFPSFEVEVVDGADVETQATKLPDGPIIQAGHNTAA